MSGVKRPAEDMELSSEQKLRISNALDVYHASKIKLKQSSHTLKYARDNRAAFMIHYKKVMETLENAEKSYIECVVEYENAKRLLNDSTEPTLEELDEMIANFNKP